MSVQTTRLAERLAALASIDLTRLASGGEVKARDVAALLPQPANVLAPAALSRTIAPLPQARSERLAHAKREIPHFYQTVEIGLDRLLAFAAELATDGQTPGLTEIVVMATARLLRRAPALNAAWQEEGLVLYDRVDVALARNSRTVLIGDADVRGLRGICQAIAAGEDGIGTFAIADFSATGLREATAIVDPHHAGVIALGAIEERAVSGEQGFVAESCCRLTLSADHRVIDGAAAAEFLSELKALLEDPIALLL